MSSETVETGVIKTKIPSRLDRLPWARFHWLIIVGLGTGALFFGQLTGHRRADPGPRAAGSTWSSTARTGWDRRPGRRLRSRC